MYKPKPISEHFLPEIDGHKVYVEEYGNQDGPVVISIHGGPGSKSSPKHAARFDLDTYRVILFDQRGCGKSESETPLQHNEIQHLIADIERIREMFSIDSWIVTGGSWGSTLALAYAEAHPDKVKALLVSAVFLGDDASLEWFSGPAGVSSLFKDVWEHRKVQMDAHAIDPITPQKINDRLNELEGDELNQLVADVLNWEGNLMSANRDVQYMSAEDVSEADVTYAKVFMHYESNRFFLENDQLLKNIDKIQHIPMAVVHGRHDVLCPFSKAWDLYKAHGNAEILALPQSNHAFSADGNIARQYFFDTFLRKRGLV